MRYKFVLAYEGTAYSGWQIQCKPSPPPTIQGAVETALFKLLGKSIRVTGSGRTDAGVHALGQVAHADLPAHCAQKDMRHALNAVLPPDIRILSASQTDCDFHARKDALCKTYIYDLWQEETFIPPNLRNFIWPCGTLDEEAMRAALPGFRGEHDFASFQNAGTCVQSTIRTVYDITLARIPGQEYLPAHRPMLRLAVTANGFLKQMVRNMAGFLWYVGRGKAYTLQLENIFAAHDRRALPSPTAPARGLYLARVDYSDKPGSVSPNNKCAWVHGAECV